MSKIKRSKAVLLGLITFAAIFLSAAYAQERPEPKLLWSRKFEEQIITYYDTPNVSTSEDGKLILVTGANNLYLLSAEDGKIIRFWKGKGMKKGEEEPWILSPDGKKLISPRGKMMDIKGRIIKKSDSDWEREERKKYGKILPLITPSRYPVYSPSGKYMAFQGAVEAEGEPFIEMYDLETGKLLWRYEPPSETFPESLSVYRIKFVDDERLAVYGGKKVGMLKVKTGEKIWEKDVFLWIEGGWSYGSGSLIINDSGDICVLIWDPGYVASVDRNGKLRWEKLLGGAIASYATLSNSGHLLAIIAKAAWDKPTYLSLVNNLNGEIVWQREVPGVGGGLADEAPSCFINDDNYLFRSREVVKEDAGKGQFLYLWDVRTGNLLWKWKPKESDAGSIQLSRDKKKLLACDEKNILYLFDISSLGGSK